MDLKVFSSILADYYTYGLAAAVVVMLFYIKRINRFHRFLVLYLVLMLLIEVIAQIVGKIYKANHSVLSLYALVELCYFVCLYRVFFLKSNVKTLLPIAVTGVLYIVFEFLYSFVFNNYNPHTYQPYCKVADNLIILFMAFSVFNSGVLANGATVWAKFWFNAIIIVYYTLDTIFFLPFNFIVNAPGDTKFIFWMVHLFSLVLLYGYFASLVFKNILSISKTVVFNEVSRRDKRS